MQPIPEDLPAWRKSLRAELIAARLAVPRETREVAYAAMGSHLDAVKDAIQGLVIGLCSPFRGEPDLRELVLSWVDAGATAAMPALVEKNTPMRFRRWSRDTPMTRGVWNIPIPDGTEVLVPDVLFIPMVAYDWQGYRLGYGGGYFDRMLADISPLPITVGVALAQSRIDTIYPQPYDIPMDCVLTEAGLHMPVSGELASLTIDAAACRLRELAVSRRLPRVQEAALEPPRVELSSPVCYAAEFPGYFGETTEKKP